MFYFFILSSLVSTFLSCTMKHYCLRKHMMFQILPSSFAPFLSASYLSYANVLWLLWLNKLWNCVVRMLSFNTLKAPGNLVLTVGLAEYFVYTESITIKYVCIRKAFYISIFGSNLGSGTPFLWLQRMKRNMVIFNPGLTTGQLWLPTVNS